jgi:hypothetical protein
MLLVVAVDAAMTDFALYGTKGVLRMDDFVLDWNNSILPKDASAKLGYTIGTGTRGCSDVRFVEIEPRASQEVLMCDNFAALVAKPDLAMAATYTETTVCTQNYLDTIRVHIKKT